MKSHFIFNIILLVVLNLIVKPLYIFGIELEVQNVLGEAAYGSYFEIWSLVFLFSIINDLGLNVNNTNEISKNPERIHERFAFIVGLKLLLGLVFLGGITVVFFFLSYDIFYYHLLLLIGIVFILNSYFAFLRSNLQGIGEFKKDSLLSVLDRLLLIIIMGYILYVDSSLVLKIEYFLYAQIGSLALAILVARGTLWNTLGTVKINYSTLLTRDLLKKSLPFATVVILMTIYSRMDGVMLGRMLTDGNVEAGIYVAGYRLFDAGGMFAYLFAGLLLPMYGKLMKEKEQLQSLSELAYKLIWVYVSVVAVTFVFYSTDIATFLYKEGTAYYGSVLMMLMISLIAIAVSYVYGTMIVAKGDMQKLNWIFVFCIVLNFVLNYILIPSHKAYGAAIATLVTQFVAMFGQIIVCHRSLSMKYNFGLYSRSLVFLGVVLGVFYITEEIISTELMDWWTRMALNIILSIIIAFIMKMIDLKFFILALRSKEIS